MRKFNFLAFLLFYVALVMLTGCGNEPVLDKEIKTEQEAAYTQVDWLSEATKDSLAQPVGVGIAPDDKIIVFHRGLAPAAPYVPGDVVAFIDPKDGTLSSSWGAGFFIQPHGMHVDGQGYVWLTDIKRQQVFKFSAEGELLLTLGEEGVKGNDAAHFDEPTDVAVAPDGNIFVTDGYGNRRVVKFSADGTFLKEWGKEGSAPGEFKNPHAIDIDDKGVLYVSDRDNQRIQVFNGDGVFQREIPTKAAVYACIVTGAPGHLLATDYLKEDSIVRGSAVFTLESAEDEFLLDRPLTDAVAPCRYHDLVVAKDGSLYLADLLSKEVHRFTR
jgi:DNA-binding beta-propeller fold protein YncE